MLVGIIIGILGWQMVVGALEMIDPWWDKTWVTCPCFNILIYSLEKILDTFSIICSYRAYIFLFSLGKNPFKMKVSDLWELSEEQKAKLVMCAKGRFKIGLENLFNRQPSSPFEKRIKQGLTNQPLSDTIDLSKERK